MIVSSPSWSLLTIMPFLVEFQKMIINISTKNRLQKTTIKLEKAGKVMNNWLVNIPSYSSLKFVWHFQLHKHHRFKYSRFSKSIILFKSSLWEAIFLEYNSILKRGNIKAIAFIWIHVKTKNANYVKAITLFKSSS